MRRIYQSSALRRDDDDPFAPHERSGGDEPQSMRTVPATWISRYLVPGWLRDRVVSVDIEVRTESVPPRTAVPFRVSIRNRAPLPVTVPTLSPLYWEWSVNGVDQASEVPTRPIDAEADSFTLKRGQELRFEREWNGMFQVTDDEWDWATPGEYTLAVRLNVDGANRRGLAAATTVTIESA